MKYSAFDRELLGVFLAIRHFRHMLEGRPFHIWTDHKPLCGALGSSAEKSPRQTRHLSYISEFCTDIRHVSGESNVVADALSRPPDVQVPCLASASFSLSDPLLELSAAQSAHFPEMQEYISGSNSLVVETVPLPDSDATILCDISSTATPRPIVPSSMIQRIISGIHDVAHPGSNATLRDVRRRFVWSGMASDVKSYCRACVPCQRSKVTTHVKSPLAPLDMPDPVSYTHLTLPTILLV